MPRPCNVCNAEEYRLAIDQRLRDGESCAAIAAEFGFGSPDSVERHKRNHVLKSNRKPETMKPTDLLRDIIAQTSELARSCKSVGDGRGAIEAISKQLTAVLSLSEHESREKDEASQPEPVWLPSGDLNPRAEFRSMTIEDFDACVESAHELRDRLKREGGCCPMCSTEFPKSKPESKLAHHLNIV